MANLNFTDFDDVPVEPKNQQPSVPSSADVTKPVRAIPCWQIGPWSADTNFVDTVCGEPCNPYDPVEDLAELSRVNVVAAHVCQQILIQRRNGDASISEVEILAAGIKCLVEQNQAMLQELVATRDKRPIVIRSDEREWTFDPETP